MSSLNVYQTIMLLQCHIGYEGKFGFRGGDDALDILKSLQSLELVTPGATHEDYDWETTPKGSILVNYIMKHTAWELRFTPCEKP